MTPERLRQIEELYHAALEDRAALSNADPDLRQEVESLLAQEGSLPALLEESPVTGTHPEPTLMARHRISHYEVLGKLGLGGMGTVYQARDLRLGRVVALKFLSPDLLDSPAARARFQREAKMLSTLNHPHIATIYEIDEANGEPFIAMEYLPGGTLRSRIAAAAEAGRFLDAGSVCRWCVGVAEALAHAHGRGVIHRDVKSGNVMFDAEGRSKLTDFGLAKMTSSSKLTTAGVAAGTVAYMAPEQALAQPLDHRSDLFSLGVVLFEAVTGRRPFEAESVAGVMYRIQHSTPPAVSAVRPDAPQPLDAIVSHLLEKAPQDRYQLAEDVARDLLLLDPAKSGSVAMGLSTVTLPLPPPAEPLPPPAGKNRRKWAIGMTLAVAAAAGITLAVLGIPWRGIGPPRLPKQKHIAVLPVRSIGGDEKQEAFCDGLTDTLTSSLTQLGTLSVVPSTDARRLTSVQQARKEFGVNLVIYSSLQVRGGQARLIVNVVDAEKDRQLGAANIDGPPDRLYQLEDGLLTQVATLIDVTLEHSSTSVLAASGQLPEATYDAYLRGRGFLYRYDRSGNLDRALQEFEAAVRSDPKFAPALVGLAQTNLFKYRRSGDAHALEAARDAALRSLGLNSLLPSARVVMGAVLAESRNYDEAVRELEAALKLDPRDPAAYRELAAAYRAEQRFGEAEQVYQKGIAARPGDWLSYSNLATFYHSRQRYADAADMFRKAIELTPDNDIAYRNLGVELIVLGRHREAEQMLKKALSLRQATLTYSNLGALYMLQGRYREAVPVMEQAVQLAAQERPNEYRIWGNLGDAYRYSHAPGDKSAAAYRHAIELAEAQLRNSASDASHLSLLANYHAKLGEKSMAEERIETAIRYSPTDGPVRFRASIVYTLLGAIDRALDELAAAISFGYSVEEIRLAPELAVLKSHPRYNSLIAGAVRR
jgi:serine/threonine protein kinase/tetratricopeptide (TPR) repeat protein